MWEIGHCRQCDFLACVRLIFAISIASMHKADADIVIVGCAITFIAVKSHICTFARSCKGGICYRWSPFYIVVVFIIEEYDRKIKIGGQDDENIQIYKMRDYAYELWLNTPSDINVVSKDVFVTAMDLDVEAHLNILKTIAFHTDMSCSKTINIPVDYPFEKTKEVYMECWKSGVKGCTIFRPNPLRQGILITEKEEEKVEEIEENLVCEQNPKAGEEVAVGTEIELTVSLGKDDNIMVPSIIGQTESDAISELMRAGFKYENIYVEQRLTGSASPGTVIEMSPAVGIRASIESKLTLYIEAEPETNDETYTVE